MSQLCYLFGLRENETWEKNVGKENIKMQMKKKIELKNTGNFT